MSKLQPNEPQNLIITVAAGYREEQIRPFLASLRAFAPKTSLRLIVDRRNREFEEAVRKWFPSCGFYLLPASPLRDFSLKRKWARSLLKRAARWSRSPGLGKRLLKINFLRHIVARDLLAGWNLNQASVLLCDSRDVVFQDDPFSGEWSLLWTCEEDKRIEECSFNGPIIIRAGGEAAFHQAKHFKIVCAGVLGGRSDHVIRYLEQSSKIVEQIAPRIALTDGDQGIHNYLARLRPELGFTVFPNGRLAANLAYTKPGDLTVVGEQVALRTDLRPPAILHQYDRHPNLTALVQAKWGNAKPST
ncbi:MAG TPA: hypothetical protein VH280_04260 [Verrucomicrobiae bacterium]|jgi:hypothetical protein|nr:hypothetical protein [Verrucomicrobiae bacterium]